jgi:hypothetical protein
MAGLVPAIHAFFSGVKQIGWYLNEPFTQWSVRGPKSERCIHTMPSGSSAPVMPTQAEPDWSAWSREAVRLMQERNRAWMENYGLRGCPYVWTFDDAQLVFSPDSNQVIADICVLGSVSEAEGTFLWAWASDTIPEHARRGLERVREFGDRNDLELLTKPVWPRGRCDGLEMAAVAGRVLDAAGVWVAPTGDVTLYFALSNFRRVPALSWNQDLKASAHFRVEVEDETSTWTNWSLKSWAPNDQKDLLCLRRTADPNIRDITDEAGIYRPSAHLEAALAKVERIGGDPEAYVGSHIRTWMPGTRPGMTTTN